MYILLSINYVMHDVELETGPVTKAITVKVGNNYGHMEVWNR